MKNFQKLMLLLVALFPLFLMAQAGKPIPPFSDEPTGFDAENFQVKVNLSEGVPRANRVFPSSINYTAADLSTRIYGEASSLKVMARDNNHPLFISGKLSHEKRQLPLETQAFEYLKAAKNLMQINEPEEEFVLLRTESDALGQSHLRMQQYFNGLLVFGSQLILHADETGSIQLLNGRYFPTPKLEDLSPTLSSASAQQIVTSDLSSFTQIKILSDYEKQFVADVSAEPELIIYHPNMDLEDAKLCWKITIIPNLLENWDYFIDAETGTILNKINKSCTLYPEMLREKNNTAHTSEFKSKKSSTTLFGGTTANATDLKGISRTINVYDDAGDFYMIDVDQDMFSASSQFPNNLSGAIITIDAQNTSPSNDNFDAVYITSSNNSWNNPKGVSAHYHAAISYEYFRGIHARNSINAQGGNIMTFINVADSDGSSMDNAFWNGAAMFYGNGNSSFNNPLQKSLDTGGHEMTHGVIGSSAGLIYQEQPGALSESFADVFGVMIDPANWQLGEDIVNTAIFTSGALRDLSDPNQGGNSLNDTGWQPAHMNEYQNLPNTSQGDNGGVHVNSGIPNYAFYLFAQQVGNSDARRVYYRALTTYLTNQAQFIDCRLAVLQAASDLFGSSSAQRNAAASAFDQVGIFGGAGSGGTDDIDTNPGQEFVLMTDENFGSLYLYDGNTVPEISTTDVLSRPSVTDDGTAIVFVATDNTLRLMLLNENTGQYEEDFLESSPQTIWRNVAVSKDGSKLAILTTDNDNFVFIFDYNTGNGQYIEIRNPTSQQGIFTDDVQYADFIEWDYTGENLLYDAYNVLDDDFGNTVDYWDIGLIRVWNNGANTFGDGFVFKIFNGLPDNTSVGNPTFSKNSPNIIALDFIGDAANFSDLELLAVDTEIGEVGSIFENNKLSYPNYSTQDDQMIFDTENNGVQILAIIDLNADKITPSGIASIFIEGGKWGVWYARGERELTAAEDINKNTIPVQISPNPFTNKVKIDFTNIQKGAVQIEVFDLMGKSQYKQLENTSAGTQTLEVDLSALPAASYFIQVKTDDGVGVVRVVKQ